MVHAHHHHEKTTEQLRTVLAVTGSVFLLEVFGGLVSGSLALLSDAAHMFTDVVALVLALTAVHFSQRPADQRRTYGYYRFEILAATFNAVLLFLVALYIFYEAWQRFYTPHPLESGWMLWVAVAGLMANGISLWILQKDRVSSLNMRAVTLEVYSDLLGSVGVVAAALIIMLTGWQWVDPLIGVLLSLWVLPRTWRILDESLNILLEGVPPGIEIPQIYAELGQLPDVESVHDLHVWALTSGHNAMTVHLVVGGDKADLSLVKEAQKIAYAHGIEHASIQVESHDTALLETPPHN